MSFQRKHPGQCITEGQSTRHCKEAAFVAGDENARCTDGRFTATGFNSKSAFASGATLQKRHVMHHHRKPAATRALSQHNDSRRPLHQLSCNHQAPNPPAIATLPKGAIAWQEDPRLRPSQLPTQSTAMPQGPVIKTSATTPNSSQACRSAGHAALGSSHDAISINRHGLSAHMVAPTHQVPHTGDMQSLQTGPLAASSGSPSLTTRVRMTLPSHQEPAVLKDLSGTSGSRRLPCAPAVAIHNSSSKAGTVAADSATAVKAARAAALLQHTHTQHPVTQIMHQQQAAVLAASGTAEPGKPCLCSSGSPYHIDAAQEKQADAVPVHVNSDKLLYRPEAGNTAASSDLNAVARAAMGCRTVDTEANGSKSLEAAISAHIAGIARSNTVSAKSQTMNLVDAATRLPTSAAQPLHAPAPAALPCATHQHAHEVSNNSSHNLQLVAQHSHLQDHEDCEDTTAITTAKAMPVYAVPTTTTGRAAATQSVAVSGALVVQPEQVAQRRTWQLMQHRKHGCSLLAGSSILDSMQQLSLAHQPTRGCTSMSADEQVAAASAQDSSCVQEVTTQKQHRVAHAAAIKLTAGAMRPWPKPAEAAVGMNPPWYDESTPATVEEGPLSRANPLRSAVTAQMPQQAYAAAIGRVSQLPAAATKQPPAERKLAAAVLPRFMQEHTSQGNILPSDVTGQHGVDSIHSDGSESSTSSCSFGPEPQHDPQHAVLKPMTLAAAVKNPADAGSTALIHVPPASRLVMRVGGTAAAATAEQQSIFLARLSQQQQQLHASESRRQTTPQVSHPIFSLPGGNRVKPSEGSNCSKLATSSASTTIASPLPAPVAEASLTDHSTGSYYSLADTAESQLSYAIAAHLLKRTPYVGLGDRAYEAKDFDYVEHAQRKLHAEPAARDAYFVRDYRCISERMKAGARRKLAWA